MRRFERDEDGELRFWQISCQGNVVELVWGGLDSRPSRLVKELPSEGKARAEHDRLVRQRLGMGYVEVTTADPATATPR